MLRSKLLTNTSISAAIAALGFLSQGCHNNDTTTPVTTTSTETMHDTAVNTTTAMPDTSMHGTMSTADTMHSTASTEMNMKMDAGNAKPNPAKKGLKGKATITVPTKGTGTMEMDNTGVYNNVEYLPSFPGGTKGLQKFFDDNLEYPTAATDDGIEGTVNVSFVVDENGKLSSPKVQGQNPGYGLETEALRVINKMPSWTPGKLKGKNVKTRFSLPVVFQLY